MWAVNGHTIKMTEGDYGLILPITITGPTFGEIDEIQFTIKDKMNGETLLTKSYTSITQNKVNIELTAAESALFPVGSYVWCLDWLQAGNFLCNIIPSAVFEVGEKI